MTTAPDDDIEAEVDDLSWAGRAEWWTTRIPVVDETLRESAPAQSAGAIDL